MRTWIVVTFFVIATITSRGYADTVTLSADEWCPYNCVPNSDKPGFMVEIAQAIFAVSGHTVVYTVRPWSRAIKDAQAGLIDGVVGTSKDDTPDFIFPELNQGFYAYGVYVRADDPWRLITLDSFQNRKIGVVRDYNYLEFSDYFNAHPGNPKIDIASSNTALEQNINKLMLKRIDTTLESTAVMSYYLDNHNLSSKIKKVGEGRRNLVYIAFAPNNPKAQEYAKLISDGMNMLRASGKLEKIMQTYGLHDWETIKEGNKPTRQTDPFEF